MRYRYQPGGSINVAVETQRLKDLGYSDEQIAQIIAIEEPDALDQYVTDMIDKRGGSPGISLLGDYEGAIRGQLLNTGYSEEDIEKILGYDESAGTYANPALQRFAPSGDASDSEYVDLAPNLTPSTSSTSSTDDLYNSLRQQGYTDLSAQKILKDEYGIGYQPGFRRRPEGTYFSPLLGSVGEAGQFLTDTYNRFFGRNQGSLSNFKRNTTSFDVTIDPNDPNKDNYVYDFDFLNQGKLPTKEEYGNYLTVRYWISDKEKTRRELLEETVKLIFGIGDVEYNNNYSEITGYLWTDANLIIGGHNLLNELYNNVGKYCLLEIEYFDESQLMRHEAERSKEKKKEQEIKEGF